MPKERIPTVEKNMYTDFDRKLYFKGKTKENDSIKNGVFEKNIELYFVEMRNKLTALPITVSTWCVTRRI